MEKKSVKKSIILNTFYNILCTITPFITAPYTARVLGAEAIGKYSYTSSVAAYFVVFIALGTAVYGTIEISKNRDNPEYRSILFWEIELLTLFTTLLASVVWGILILISAENRIFYCILTMNLLAALLDISWFYAGMERYEYAVSQNCVIRIVRIILLLMLVKKPDDLWIYFTLMSGGSFIANILFWFHLPKYLVRINIKKLSIQSHLKGTLVFFVPSVANTMYAMLDKTLLGILTTNSAENGYYAQAAAFLSLLQAVCFAGLNTVLMSRNSYLYQQGQKQAIKKKISLSIDYILFMGIGAAFGISLISRHFVPWFYGQGYDRTAIILIILSPVVPIIGISNCLGGQYYNPAGLRAKSTKYLIIGIVINLILNCCLIPYFGGVGAALASVMAEGTAAILYIANSDGFCTFSAIIGKLWRKVLAGLLMVIVVYPIGMLFNSEFCAVVVQTIAGSMVYIFTLYLLKDRTIIKMVLQQVTGLFRKRRKK